MSHTNTPETIDLICNVDAIAPQDRETHLANAHRLVMQAYLEIKELADGYAFKFAAEEYETLVQYIAYERLCCSFFTFELKVAPNHGPIWLHIGGNEQIKAFLTTELQANGNQDVVKSEA